MRPEFGKKVPDLAPDDLILANIDLAALREDLGLSNFRLPVDAFGNHREAVGGMASAKTTEAIVALTGVSNETAAILAHVLEWP